jgi:hypothetical protein
MTGPGGFAFIGIDENDELAETTDVENEEARLNPICTPPRFPVNLVTYTPSDF